MDMNIETIGTMIGSAITTAAAMFFIVKYFYSKERKTMTETLQKEYELLRTEYKEKYDEAVKINKLADDLREVTKTTTKNLDLHKTTCKTEIDLRFVTMSNDYNTRFEKMSNEYNMRFEQLKSAIEIINTKQESKDKAMEATVKHIESKIETLFSKIDVMYNKMLDES